MLSAKLKEDPLNMSVDKLLKIIFHDRKLGNLGDVIWKGFKKLSECLHQNSPYIYQLIYVNKVSQGLHLYKQKTTTELMPNHALFKPGYMN